jgi:hypothetical protein
LFRLDTKEGRFESGETMNLTSFKAGGLRPTPLYDKPLHRVAAIMQPNYVLAPQISRIYDCRPNDDQGNAPACAVYATIASLKMKFWEVNGYPKDDYDHAAAYAEAKRTDGLPGDGTTIDAAIAACKTLGYCLDYSQRGIESVDEWKWALRHYDNVITGLEICDGWNRVGADGLIPDGGAVLGGHGIVGVEYNERGPTFGNSWRPWGLNQFGQITWAEYERTFMEARAVEWVFAI